MTYGLCKIPRRDICGMLRDRVGFSGTAFAKTLRRAQLSLGREMFRPDVLIATRRAALQKTQFYSLLKNAHISVAAPNAPATGVFFQNRNPIMNVPIFFCFPLPACHRGRHRTAPLLWTFFMLAIGLAGQAGAAEAEDFRTPEYWNSTGLERINAAEAYALGFTGKGVVVGVVDGPFAPQTGEFAVKYPYGLFNYEEDEEDNDHGIHVTGIIAARRDGVGMHGAAFDAALLPVSWGYPLNFPDRYAFLEDIARRSVLGECLPYYASWEDVLAYPDVRIVNNSWGDDFFQDQIDSAFSKYVYPAGFIESALMQDPGWQYVTGLTQRLAEADVLQIFAAGNEGHLSPTVTANMPSVLLDYGDPDQKDIGRALSLRWLNVTAFDPDQPASSPGFVAPFTNMGWKASAYTLWAPGVDINSTIAPSDYAPYSGTSMSAPYVSGTAALAQSAFPYMGGKQLADVLLSTATPFTTPGVDVPPVFLLLRNEYDENGVMLDYTNLAIYTTGNHTISTAEREVMIEAVIKWSDWDRDEASDLVDASYVVNLPLDEYLSLFGAGIVNAGKAVRGPGYFDARRLDNADKKTYNGTDYYAMYGVDTQGYNSVWSNNIGQVKVKAPSDPDDPVYPYIRDLTGLDVGLLKQGDGLLALSGQNTYLGPTVVAGGEISLGVTGQHDSAARLAGSVIVERAGTFSGNGLIKGYLQFSGLLSPGLASTPGSKLTVEGNITGGGILLSRLWTDGSVNPLIGLADIDLNHSTVRLADLPGGRALPQPKYLLAQANNLTGTTANDFAVARQGVSLLHDFNLQIQDNALYALHERSRAAPEAKALSEGFLAGSVLLHQGADIIAGQGMDAAVASARHAAHSGPVSGPGSSPGAAFGILTGGNVRYHTGSHVDMRSASLLTGLAVEIEQRESDLTLA
ncbi:MAG: S8 family serine peptidase, partial [Azoarcus sp.]|nr:S8 family serine peptidase [Azoarcus sp.]